jgi:outer membrane protein assembly factor BamD
MKKRNSLLPLLTMTLLLAACGGKDKVKNENAATPGRDKELYEQAYEKARKGRYDEARLLYNVVITTYADSPYLPLAKLAIADSFYLEGGTSNLEQAIGGYKDFAQLFPLHPDVCGVKHKIAHSLMRQMGAYNRDASKAKGAEFQLKAALQSCQVSPLKPQIENDLRDVQQVLALHELSIARFYIETRQAYKAGESRLRDIVTQYPFFSYYDESLYLLGVSLIEQEQPEEAADHFTRLVRDYPNSQHAGKGKEYLEKLGKPIPAPSNNNPAPERPNLMGRFGLIIGRNGLDISKDGVLLSRSGDEKEDVKEATVRPNDASNQPGTRAIRANTKSNIATAQVQASAPAPAANGATGDAANGNGNGAPAAGPAATPAKKEDDKNDKNDKKKKKKKGLLGIFK